MVCLNPLIELFESIENLFKPIVTKLWVERIDVIHVVFNMVIGGVDIVYKKLKLKAHKLDKPRGKSQSLMLVKFHYG
jgi:hypothetical protein